MEDNVLISVVIPAFNNAVYLEKAIESALQQTYRDIEVIIVDDASPDCCGEIAEKLSLIDKRVYCIHHSENRGVAEARNTGVLAARGEWIAFLDADDFWAPEKLQIQLDTINAKSGCLCYSGARFFYGDSTFCGKDISVPESVTFKELCHGNVIITSSVLIKKKYLLEFTMERSDLHEDYITWLKILNKYGKAIGINKPLTLHRLTKASKSDRK